MKNVTVHSNGFGGEQSIIVDEDGNTLENVRAATIYVQSGEMTEVNIEVIHAKINAIGRVREVEFICPCCDIHLVHKCDKVEQPTDVHASPKSALLYPIDSSRKKVKVGTIVSIDPPLDAHRSCRLND